MPLTDTDRRRFFVATAITLLALPALWWANESGRGGGPGIATVGVELGAGEDTTDPTDDADGIDDAVAPVFLDGASGSVGAGLPEIAVPAKPTIDHIRADATFRSTTPFPSACLVPGVSNGETVIVVNLDTNRSVRCTTVITTGAAGDQIVLHTDLFSQIADLTEAPIPVEIRR
jgi:hypothetical protein